MGGIGRLGKKVFVVLSILSIVCLSTAMVCFADEADTIEDAFKGGKVSGTIGSYIEHRIAEASDSDFGWSTAYLTLKYETLSWNRLKFGARFFAHGELHSDHDNETTDPYNVDIEKKFTLPEMYLTYGFLDDSSATVGRWKNVGHIDDAQSEGGYVKIKEIENLEILVGVMTRFAEADYDDNEDFGRSNDAQDLDADSTYGENSSSYLIFLEATYKPMDFLKLNPFYMHHDDYANVTGIETHVKGEWEEHEIKYGGKIIYEHVNADIAGSSDADIFVVMPYIKKGPVALDFSYQKYDDGDSLNHPAWAKDSFNLVDQDAAKNNAGAEVFETRIKLTIDKVWTSFAFATADFDTSATEGDGYQDYELQVGYQITDNLDINVRYFMVSFDNIDDKDYDKVESRVRFKF
ncbi:MAG: hypothetical protein KAJ18_08510 [Candidatus Omnitrophica bacterium]|nr:hypothetical protein [Candidatus Omnitrophota bacterium]